jgi:cold shock CspA family protein
MQTPSIKRRGTVTSVAAPDRPFVFLKDEINGVDIFVDSRVSKQCGVKLMRGDVVEYEIDSAALQTGKCPAAVSVRII